MLATPRSGDGERSAACRPARRDTHRTWYCEHPDHADTRVLSMALKENEVDCTALHQIINVNKKSVSEAVVELRTSMWIVVDSIPAQTELLSTVERS